MIKIEELRVLRGPNRHTRHPTIFMVLNIKEYENKPSNIIEGFSERLIKLIPTLQEHKCSIGIPGGFIQRLKEGTWAGHIIEHIAIELQCLAGMKVVYGKTLDTSKTGIYIAVFQYIVESVGLEVAKNAVSLFEAVVKKKSFDIRQVVSNLKILRENDMLGPTTWSIVKEAKSRKIPFIRLNKDSYIQLGYGAHQKKIQASMTCQTSGIAVEIADEKAKTKTLLRAAGIPVPKGKIVSTQEEAIDVFNEIGTNVVLKPNIGNHGRGATINIKDLDELKMAFQIAQSFHSDVIVEEFVYGQDFRFLVIDGKLVAAANRKPAHLVGDGESSIKDLIETLNMDPRRGFGHEKILTQIKVDEMTRNLLLKSEFSMNSVPKKGETVYLKTTANLSQGGTSSDVTEEVNPDITLMMERAAKIIGLNCVGIDVLAKDISLPINVSGIKIIEVNAAPGFRMHLNPTIGKPRNVAKPLLDMLFPMGYSQIPVLAITGTNGKTTTSKLITHTLKYSGKNVGLACTTGIIIDGKTILSGDYSGPKGAEIVTREPTVDHIVLEVARGGIIRRGLGVDEVDVGVVLNIGEDHLGTDWIESQEDLCLVKSTVIEVVKKEGTSVLNAEDEMTMSILSRARGKIILFSLNASNEKIKKHIKIGGTVVTINKRDIIVRNKELDIIICTIEEIPMTLGGIIDFNISNAMAAIGALYGLNLPIEQIRNGVMTFYSSPNQNPGRMNLFDFQKFKVLLDYGHNPESARAIAKFLPLLTKGRKIALCHGTGNRTTEQIIKYGEALAPLYDRIMVVDFDPRDRPLGETSKLVYKGLIKGGFQEQNIEIVPVSKQGEAVNLLFSKAKAGDLLVIQIDEFEPIMNQIMEKYREVNSNY